MLPYKEAGASPDQQKQIRALADKFEAKAHGEAEQAQKLMAKLRELSLQPMPDEKTMLSTQDALNHIQMSMSDDRIHLLLDMRKVLNDAQRKKLVDLLRAHSGPR